jgi:hypothetical protein
MPNPIPLFNARIPPEEDAARLRQEVADSLHRALTNGISAAFQVPVYLAEAFQREVWKHDRMFENGQRQPPISFHEFVHSPHPVGLGTTFEAIRPFITHDIALLALYDKACQRPDGNPTGRNQYSDSPEVDDGGTVDNIHSSSPTARPNGTSKQAGLRRLEKAAESGDPKARDLREQVLRGEVSVNAACLTMGWRKPVGVVETMKRAWQKATLEEREEVRAWIEDNGDDDSEKQCDCGGKELLIGTFFAGGKSLLQRHTDDVRAASLAEFEASPDPTWLDMVNIMEKAGQRAALKIYERHADEYLEALRACAPPPPPEPEPMRRKRSRK